MGSLGEKDKGIALYFKEVVDPEVVGPAVPAALLPPEVLVDEAGLARHYGEVGFGTPSPGGCLRQTIRALGGKDEDHVAEVGVQPDAVPVKPQNEVGDVVLVQVPGIRRRREEHPAIGAFRLRHDLFSVRFQAEVAASVLFLCPAPRIDCRPRRVRVAG